MDTEVITWSAYEHQPFAHEPDWFWALGIIAVAAATTAVILGDILFGVVILCAAGTIGLLARTEVTPTTFSLTRKGLSINGTLYSSEQLHAFWIAESKKTEGEYLLLIDTPHFMTPDLIIPVTATDVHAIHAWFVRNQIPEKELRESFALKVMEFFGI